jgi:phosphoglycerate transport regulatory protein PgtC
MAGALNVCQNIRFRLSTHAFQGEMMVRRALLAASLVAGFSMAFASGAAIAGTVTVITSFPKELTSAYKAAFEKANPGVTLEVLNKSTVAGIAFVRETAAGQRPDVFWASAPDAFEVLKRDKLLVAAPDVDNKAIPAKIGNWPATGSCTTRAT